MNNSEMNATKCTREPKTPVDGRHHWLTLVKAVGTKARSPPGSSSGGDGDTNLLTEVEVADHVAAFCEHGSKRKRTLAALGRAGDHVRPAVIVLADERSAGFVGRDAPVPPPEDDPACRALMVVELEEPETGLRAARTLVFPTHQADEDGSPAALLWHAYVCLAAATAAVGREGEWLDSDGTVSSAALVDRLSAACIAAGLDDLMPRQAWGPGLDTGVTDVLAPCLAAGVRRGRHDEGMFYLWAAINGLPLYDWVGCFYAHKYNIFRLCHHALPSISPPSFFFAGPAVGGRRLRSATRGWVGAPAVPLP